MAGAADFNYESLDQPYDNNMQRSPSVEITPSTGYGTGEGTSSSSEGDSATGEGKVIKAGQEFVDVWLSTWMKSRNYQPKTQGFYIDGKLGYIECMQLFVGKGGIEGGSIHIPSQESILSWHVDNLGNMWSGANLDQWNSDPTRANQYAKAVIQNDGRARFFDIIIDSGIFFGAMFITDTDGSPEFGPGPAAVRVEIGSYTNPLEKNDIKLYENTLGSGTGVISGDVAAIKFRRLAYPNQEFVIQKRVGAYSSDPTNADNIAEFFYTNPRQGTGKNRILIGFRGDGYLDQPVYINTQNVHVAAENGVRLQANYASITLANNQDEYYPGVDAQCGRAYVMATASTANGYDPVSDTGGGAIVFRIPVPFVTVGKMAWIDVNGFWFYDSCQYIRPYTTDFNRLGDGTHRFDRVYSKQFHFLDGCYFWYDPGGPPTVNLTGANLYVAGGIGAQVFDASLWVIVAGNTFTPQTITYKDGAGVNQTRTFLMV
jgi:hypothetical protein